jgi:hypothetical protein
VGTHCQVRYQISTNHQEAIDAHELVDDIYRHSENFMHASGIVMQPDYLSKPEDLYLWCLIAHSKTCCGQTCRMRYSCGCDTCIRITEKKQILTLETIRVHDLHSHTGGKMHAHKSAPRCQCGALAYSGSRAKQPRTRGVAPPRT